MSITEIEVDTFIYLDKSRKPVSASTASKLFPKLFRNKKVLALIPVKYGKEEDGFIKDTLAQDFLGLPKYITVKDGEDITHDIMIKITVMGDTGVVTLHPTFNQETDHLTWSKATIKDIWRTEENVQN